MHLLFPYRMGLRRGAEIFQEIGGRESVALGQWLPWQGGFDVGVRRPLQNTHSQGFRGRR